MLSVMYIRLVYYPKNAFVVPVPCKDHLDTVQHVSNLMASMVTSEFWFHSRNWTGRLQQDKLEVTTKREREASRHQQLNYSRVTFRSRRIRIIRKEEEKRNERHTGMEGTLDPPLHYSYLIPLDYVRGIYSSSKVQHFSVFHRVRCQI